MEPLLRFLAYIEQNGVYFISPLSKPSDVRSAQFLYIVLCTVDFVALGMQTKISKYESGTYAPGIQRSLKQ